MKASSFSDAARQVLTSSGSPMSVPQIWEAVQSAGIYESAGQTPEQTLQAVLLRGAVGVNTTQPAKQKLFYKASPNSFGLVEWLDDEELAALQADEAAALHSDGQASDTSYDIEGFLAAQDPARLEFRKSAAAVARDLISENIGRLTEEQLRELFDQVPNSV